MRGYGDEDPEIGRSGDPEVVILRDLHEMLDQATIEAAVREARSFAMPGKVRLPFAENSPALSPHQIGRLADVMAGHVSLGKSVAAAQREQARLKLERDKAAARTKRDGELCRALAAHGRAFGA